MNAESAAIPSFPIVPGFRRCRGRGWRRRVLISICNRSPVTMEGLNATRQTLFTRSQIDDLASSGNRSILFHLNGLPHRRGYGRSARLAALIPCPQVKLTRYHVVFAPNHRLRSAIVPSQESSPAKAAELGITFLKDFQAQLALGGFPEPFLGGSVRAAPLVP